MKSVSQNPAHLVHTNKQAGYQDASYATSYQIKLSQAGTLSEEEPFCGTLWCITGVPSDIEEGRGAKRNRRRFFA